MLVYMFPGQGSQYKGMGEELFDKFPEETMNASVMLGYDIKDLCLYDSDNLLKETQYTQPAIYFVSCLSYLNRINQTKEKPHFFCGHSLGEYAALYAAGVFDLLQGLKLVKKRGACMAKISQGSLMAVLGDNIDNISEILSEKNFMNIDIANYNAPDQIVVGGSIIHLEPCQVFLESLNFKCINLNVSGAFHTRLMEESRIEYMNFLINEDFLEPMTPVVSSSSCEFFQSKYALEILGFQLIKPVYWVQTMKSLQKMGCSSFIEVGPGEVLSRLIQKIIN